MQSPTGTTVGGASQGGVVSEHDKSRYERYFDRQHATVVNLDEAQDLSKIQTAGLQVTDRIFIHWTKGTEPYAGRVTGPRVR